MIIKQLKYTTNPYHTLILASLTTSYYSLLGPIDSIKKIINQFHFIPSEWNDVLLVCYIFLRQFGREKSEEFLEFYQEQIDSEKIKALNRLVIF